MPTQKDDDFDAILQVKLPRKLRDDATALAADREYTLSGLVRHLLRQELKRAARNAVVEPHLREE